MATETEIKRRFWFEFMDQDWIPASLHATLREVLGFHLRVTLGYYYIWAAERTLAKAEAAGVHRVAELGAGAAGFSETLARLVEQKRVKVAVDVSDLRPDAERYKELARAFPATIHAHLEPVNLLEQPLSGEPSVVVMSAVFHHVPHARRRQMLEVLSRHRVLIFESVTRTVPSMVGCAIGFLPALATPLYFFSTPSGRWRRFLWCWLIPVAPLMVAWDGVVSCLRCWTEEEWRHELAQAGVPRKSVDTERKRFSHMIAW
jgi:hypothetical protein